MKSSYFYTAASLMLIIIFIAVVFGNKENSRYRIRPLITSVNQNEKEAYGGSTFRKTLSLDNIFSNNHTLLGISPDKIITIIATGDIIPARSVNFLANQKNDFLWPYRKTAEWLNDADLTFANLETPLLDNCPLMNTGMIFCGSSRNVEGLNFAGIDIVSLANNHAGNYGEKGVEETTSILENNAILVTGTSKSNLVIKNIKGYAFAFLGFNDITKPQPGVSLAYDDQIKTQIKTAREKADVVIVTYHWGEEYRSQPDDRQKTLGHLSIDAGADLVIGNHPHWIQPVEIYKDKFIAYAHGNFVFDQEWSKKTKEGVVGKYIFFGNSLVDVQYFPVKIIDYGQPYFLDKDEKEKILEEMQQESLILQSKKTD